MKKYIKTLICFVVFALISLSLVSCIDGDVAKATVNVFFDEIEAGNYEAASKHLHPERPADLKTFFESVEATKKVDFGSGIEIIRYTGVQSSHYDTTVGGSTYVTRAQIKIGDTPAEMEIELVDNEKGYGIYNFDIIIEK